MVVVAVGYELLSFSSRPRMGLMLCLAWDSVLGILKVTLVHDWSRGIDIHRLCSGEYGGQTLLYGQ